MPRAHDPPAARAARRRLSAAGAVLAALMAWTPLDPAQARLNEPAAVPVGDGVLLASFRAKPKPGPRLSAPSSQPAPSRADAPLAPVVSSGPGQAGYVHYFVIQGPDDEAEIQVGIELADERIAWSFPGLGAVISPFIAEGTVTAGDAKFHVWHLYGLRPFPGGAEMEKLARELPARIRPWLAARTPHCEHESAGADCMSCLGFVLRALFPGRGRAPDLPRDWPAGAAGKYTTRDLLLYLTGMLHLPTREARLRRIAGQPLPSELREELEHLVHHLGAFDTASSGEAAAGRVRPGARAPKLPARPPQRRKL